MDGNVFISHRSWHFSFVVIIIKLLFPICTLNRLVSNYVSRQEKSISRRNESIINLENSSHSCKSVDCLELELVIH